MCAGAAGLWVGGAFRTGFLFGVKMLTGAFLRCIAGCPPDGVVEFGPDGGFEGEALMLLEGWRVASESGEARANRRVLLQVLWS